MRFEAPWAFFLVLLIPWVVIWARRGRRGGALRFSATADAARIMPSLRRQLVWLPMLLRCLVLLLIITAMARPQQGRERVREVSKGVAIEMVVDRSGSMGAEMEFGGTRMTRLDVVKRVFAEFVNGNGRGLEGRPNDLLGMISFARYADTVCPLTLAHGALNQFLESVKLVKQEKEDGTAIGDAVALAAARLKTAEETLTKQVGKDTGQFEIKSKVIILLTDGRNNIGVRTPAQAAALAKEWGIKIYAIGVSGEEGMLRHQGILGAFLMSMGEGVDQKTLKMLAEQTGGIFRMAEDGEALREVYKEIDEMERSEIESVRFLDYHELFLPFALTALALLALEVLLSCTVFRRIP